MDMKTRVVALGATLMILALAGRGLGQIGGGSLVGDLLGPAPEPPPLGAGPVATTGVDVSVDGPLDVSVPVDMGIDDLPVQAQDPGIRPGTGGLGGVIAGASEGERQVWRDGRDLFFSREFTLAEGLGPRFNSTSCISCHSQPAVGGTAAAQNPQAFIPTQFPGNRLYSFISPDGPTVEARVIRKPDGTPDGGVHALFVVTGGAGAESCQIEQEDLDGEFQKRNLSFRIPTPVFGTGLIENIPDETILAGVGDRQEAKRALGILGRAARVRGAFGGDPNRNGNTGTVARFGWKAQNASMVQFAGEAMNVEMGVSNELFVQERDETPSCQFRSVPNDFTPADNNPPVVTSRPTQMRTILDHMAFLMRFHKQPSPVTGDYTTENGTHVTAASVRRGERLFTQIGCVLCHTPMMRTSPVAQSPALRDQPVGLFSDLLLHKMGKGLADGVSQGEAGPDEFRTAPLWGVGQRIFLLHDGRTRDMVEAILAHASEGSEATQVVRKFRRLSPQDQQALINFLRSL